MELNQLATRAYENAVWKGFYEAYQSLQQMLPLEEHNALNDYVFSQKIALIHDEIDEAYQVEPVGEFDWRVPTEFMDYVEEIADVVIRVFDLAGFMELDLLTPYSGFNTPSYEPTLMSIHSSVSKVLRKHRKAWAEESIAEELAWVIHICEEHVKSLEVNFTLEQMIRWKMAKNTGREYKHGAQY